MKKETDREQRKRIWIERATSHFDSPKIRKEAEEMFEKANPENKISKLFKVRPIKFK